MVDENLQLRAGRNNPPVAPQQALDQFNNDILLITEPEVAIAGKEGEVTAADVFVFNGSPGPLTFSTVIVDPELGEIVVDQQVVLSGGQTALAGGFIVPPDLRFVLRTAGGPLTDVHAQVFFSQLIDQVALITSKVVTQLTELAEIREGSSFVDSLIEVFNFGTDATMTLSVASVAVDGYEVSKGSAPVAPSFITPFMSGMLSSPQKMKIAFNHLPLNGAARVVLFGLYIDKLNLPEMQS